MQDKLERFTEAARDVFERAEHEAAFYKQASIGTEHLLLGMLRSRYCNAFRVLYDYIGLSTEEVDSFLQQRPTASPSQEVSGLSPEVKASIAEAVDEARCLKHLPVATAHLLLGLAQQKEGLAAEIFSHFEITPQEIRRQTLRYLKMYQGKEESAKDLAKASRLNAEWRRTHQVLFKVNSANALTEFPMSIDEFNGIWGKLQTDLMGLRTGQSTHIVKPDVIIDVLIVASEKLS
jgi:ATP-dependent Clp protease ATP-binding subunit ClpA